MHWGFSRRGKISSWLCRWPPANELSLMPHHSQQLLWNMILKATRKDSLLVCAQRTPERERWRMTESSPGGCQADGLAHGSASAVNLHQSVAHTHSHTHTYCNTLSWSHCVVAREQLGIVTEWFVGLLQRWYWPGNVQGPRLSGPFGDYRARLVLWYCLKHAVLFRTYLLSIKFFISKICLLHASTESLHLWSGLRVSD